MELFLLNGVDYSQHIRRKGLSWTRNDLDSDKTTRTRDGRLRRDKLTTKRQLKLTLGGLSRAELARLDSDLSAPTFLASYLDIHGPQTREFYCSAFSARLSLVSEQGDELWEAAEFTLTEV